MDIDPRRSLELARRAEEEAEAIADESNLAQARLIQGIAHLNLHQLEFAEQKLFKARGGFEALNDREYISRCCHALAGVKRVKGELDSVRELEEQALSAARQAGHFYLQCVALQGLGMLAYREGRMQEALTFHLRSLAIARSINDKSAQVSGLQNIAAVYNHCGLLDRALDSLVEARNLLQNFHNVSFQAYVFNLMGNTYLNQGRPSLALDCYRSALEIFERLDNPFGIADTTAEIAALLKDAGDTEQALSLARQSAAIAQDCGNERKRIEAMSLSCAILMEGGDSEAAGAQLVHCLDACLTIDDITTVNPVKLLQARFYVRYESPRRAQNMVSETIDHFQQTDDVWHAIQLHIDYAAVLEQRRQRLQSIRELEKALKLAQKGPYREALIDVHKRLHTVLKSMGKTEEAARHLEAAFASQSEAAALERKTLMDRSLLRQEFQTLEIRYLKDSDAVWQPRDERLRALLNQHSTSLTPTEEKVCLMIHDKLQSKEIAAALGTSYRTIEWHRRNIRRKLAIPPQQTIQSFLLAMTEAG